MTLISATKVHPKARQANSKEAKILYSLVKTIILRFFIITNASKAIIRPMLRTAPILLKEDV